MVKAKWQATARGQETGREFVYEVEGPAGATPADIERATLAMHGHNVLTGVVDEVVHPVIEITSLR